MKSDNDREATTLRPNGTRPPKDPETFGEAFAMGLDLVAEELDVLREGVANGNRQVIEDLGAIKVKLGGLQEQFHEAREENVVGFGRIEKLLADLAEDFAQHQRSVNDRLGQLERRAANGASPPA